MAVGIGCNHKFPSSILRVVVAIRGVIARIVGPIAFAIVTDAAVLVVERQVGVIDIAPGGCVSSPYPMRWNSETAFRAKQRSQTLSRNRYWARLGFPNLVRARAVMFANRDAKRALKALQAIDPDAIPPPPHLDKTDRS